MSATNVARAGKRGNICVGNNVSATMCPRLPVPLQSHSLSVIDSVFYGIKWAHGMAGIPSATEAVRSALKIILGTTIVNRISLFHPL